MIRKSVWGRRLNINKLLIIGAGGHGRCCLDIAREYYHEIAFLDDGLAGQTVNGCKVIGSMDKMNSFYPEYQDIFIAVGNNRFRKQLVQQAIEIGYDLINLVSKRSVVSNYAKIGNGTVIFPNAVIENNVNIGSGCIITANTTINHDTVIEDYVLIYSNTVIRPNTLIEKLSRIGSSCTVTFGSRVKAGSDISDSKVVDEHSEMGEENVS